MTLQFMEGFKVWFTEGGSGYNKCQVNFCRGAFVGNIVSCRQNISTENSLSYIMTQEFMELIKNVTFEQSFWNCCM